MLPQKTEIIVIGAGLFGSSIAYHLAKEGREVIVLEKRNIASGASGRNGGQVIQLEGRDKNPATIQARLQITKTNNEILQNLERELGRDLEYQRIGSLDLALNKQQWQDMKLTVSSQKKAGDKEIELLDKKETLKLCPLLTEKTLGSRFRPSDGTINPFFLTHGFAFKAQEIGTRIFTHTAVKNIMQENSRAAGVELEDGRKIKSHIVVNATNA